ncbi:MAG TPA: hypothetical protein V6D47_08330 [Oscillatoriaceae cyanobacterium]
MRKLMMVAKFAWIYTSSMFLPTTMLTSRIEKALHEFDEEKQRQAERVAARVAVPH